MSIEKPTMEKYGWHTQCGEEAYYKALEEWESSVQVNHWSDDVIKDM